MPSNRQYGYYEVVSQLDPLVTTFMVEYTSNHMVGLCLAPILLYGIYIDYALYVKPNLQMWSLLRQIWTDNGRNFGALNREYLLQYGRWRDVTSNLSQSVTWIRNVWYCKEANFQLPSLPHLPNLSVQTRTRAILVKFYLKRIELWYQNGNGKLIIKA